MVRPGEERTAALDSASVAPIELDGPTEAWGGLPRLPAWAPYAILACGHLLLAQLGYLLVDPETGVAAWWPPSGLYLAALILAPRRRWIGVVGAMLPAALLGSALGGRSPGVGAGFFAGNTLVALASAALVLRAAGLRPSASTVRGAFALAVAPALAAAAAGAVQTLAQGGEPSSGAWAFWHGSALGAVLVAPLLLAFAAPPRWRRPTARRAAEAIALCAGLALSLLLAMAANRGRVAWAHASVLVLPLLWAALRFGVRGATLAMAAVAFAAVRLSAAGPPVAGAQLLLAVLVLATLLVAAAAEERRRTTFDLARSRELLDAFFALNPAGMFIRDDRLRAVVVSPSLEDVLGAPAREILGRTADEVLPGPDARALVAIERAALAGGTPVEREIRMGERVFRSVFFPIPRPGRPSYLGGFAVEVTDRVRAEVALRTSEERLELVEAAIDQCPDPMSLLDEEGRHVWANASAARLLGLPKDRVVGAMVSELITGTDPLDWRERRDATAACGTLVREQPIRARDGKTFPAEVASTLVQFRGRRYFAVAARDASDRLRAEESARLSAIGTLAAGVAHEINNPLSYVMSNLAWLREELGEAAPHPLAAEARQVIDEAQEGARRVRDVVQQLRNFARPDESVRRLDIRIAARSAIAVIHNELRHRASLVTRFAEDVPPVVGNEKRLAQVFLNLLENAAQAIPDGRAAREAILVEIRAVDGSVVAEVSDTGAGIPPAARARIFEPFFTTRPNASGTGLGLYTCHEIITGMGGRIEVESEVGAGSTFRIVLPAAGATAHPEEGAAAPTRAPQRARVLVLDDDARVASALRRVLERDHDVDVATDARTVLDRVRAGTAWDVVFCDLMMPEMTGMEWFEQVSAVAPALAPRVVFVTGGAFTDAARAFLERVTNPRLEKPFAPVDVRALVARFASQERHGRPGGAP